jgi:hypothetical protein
MAEILSNFEMTTDFSTQRQVNHITIDLFVPGGTKTDGQTFEATVNVPEGQYLENTTLTVNGVSTPASFAYEYNVSSYFYIASISVYRKSPTQYALIIGFNSEMGLPVTTPDYTLHADTTLSLLPN